MTKSAAEQQQFLTVVDRDTAERQWRAAFLLADDWPTEQVSLDAALGRVLAETVISPVDVPGFDRSNLDGFAVRACDTYGASELEPLSLSVLPEVIATAVVPSSQVSAGQAAVIATGGMLPRGADAIVKVEDTTCTQQADGQRVQIRRAVTSGTGISFAGTDIGCGETIYRTGQLLTSRETGVLAAVGIDQVQVRRLPRVGIVSTGNEIISPSDTMRPGMVYDSNSRILADAVRELGGQPCFLGIVADDVDQLRSVVRAGLEHCDLLLLSGGTSKGEGDLAYRVIEELSNPGVVVHGVALKPGKPICLAAENNVPVVILPGFPTSAIFTFHEFVADVIREQAGQPSRRPQQRTARLAMRVNSEIGRTEFLLVGLIDPAVHNGAAEPITNTDDSVESQARKQAGSSTTPLLAYPLGKGSGSVTAFSHADGFITLDRHQEFVDEDQAVQVTLLGRDLPLADLVVIGSHCVGLDFLLTELQRRGVRTKFLAVGSTAGLRAVQRGECDLAGIHLLDAESGEYNQPFLSPTLRLTPGYQRQQGLVFRSDDSRFAQRSLQQILATTVDDPDCLMINRNQGSGTRVLIDQLLASRRPAGYAVEARSHNAVAAAVRQRRGDWGLTIAGVARQAGLGFVPVREEQYDFVTQAQRSSWGLEQFQLLWQDAEIRQQVQRLVS